MPYIGRKKRRDKVKISRNLDKKRSLIQLGFVLIPLIIIISYFLFVDVQKERELLLPPVVREINNNQVRIIWETALPEVGVLLYHKRNGHEEEVREDEERTYHSIILNDLEPDTFYSFSLSEGNNEYYSFKTPPTEDKAFRFLVFHKHNFLDPEWIEKIIELSNTHMPDFVITAGGNKADSYLRRERDLYKAIHDNILSLPIYLVPDAETLSSIENKERYYYTSESDKTNNFFFDFGNSRFIVIGPEIGVDGIVDGIFISQNKEWLEKAVSAAPTKDHIFVFLTHYNREDRNQDDLEIILSDMIKSKKIQAVFNIGYSGSQGEIAGLEKIYNIKESFMIVDVDVVGVAAQLGNYQALALKHIVIKEFPTAVQRSCVYCRKLLERKQYEESIQWYRNFINEFGNNYMVDDSQFEIANIYDRYLYDYENAIKEYRILVNNYPYSNKAKQAKQRIEYLLAHSQYSFEPLKAFEKAKMETFVQDVGKAIEEVEKILNEYPDSNLKPQLLDWLGRNFAERDCEKSIKYLQELANGNYGEQYRENALIAIGDTLYMNGKYKQAIEIFKEAETGENREALAGKIYRCERNIRREIIKHISILIIVVLVLVSIFKKPYFFTKEELRLAGILALVYLLAGAICWRSFFTHYPSLILYIVAISASGAIIPIIVLAINRKLFNIFNALKNRLFSSFLIIVLTVLLSLSVIYLVIYIYNVHYLVAFHL